ncbi:hypothetical protein ACHAXM_006430 [Skeletonema potamos]
MGKFENAARGGLDPGTSNVDTETDDASSEAEFRGFNLLSIIEWLLLLKFKAS